ncbi:MAG: hypothetical protein LYZ69_06700 [Nitrososphaerales archaeon]|nr:hypothetical protein [Nitrososphaerales archaeon]
MIGVLLGYLLLSGAVYAYATPGATLTPPSGFQASNLDPNINSPLNNQIYDPNFIPGFEMGLQNVSIGWRTGNGYAKIGYSVGPWARSESTIPHLAVGPQCCNFFEVPHTQQFRLPAWGDYYYVRAGFGPPGVNVQNYTTNFGVPAYVGLRTDWNWTVSLALNWTEPILLNRGNEWAAVGIVATQYVPSLPGKLAYTEVNFWMDPNSSSVVKPYPDGVSRAVSPPNLVTYHPLQLSQSGNLTVTLDMSAYLRDTLQSLGLTTQGSEPPVISYVYLNVEGYNVRWDSTLWWLGVMAPSQGGQAGAPGLLYVFAGAVVAASVVWMYYRLSRRVASSPSLDQQKK